MCRVLEDHGKLCVEVIVLRDPQNPQGLARPRVLIPEKAAPGWWLQGKGKPTSCSATHTAMVSPSASAESRRVRLENWRKGTHAVDCRDLPWL